MLTMPFSLMNYSTWLSKGNTTSETVHKEMMRVSPPVWFLNLVKMAALAEFRA